MEHGNLNHHTVSRRKIHMVADIFTVVDHVIVRKHNALGKSRCAGRILHIANVILIDGSRHTVNFTYGNLRRAFKCIVPIYTSLLFKANGNNVAQERQTLAVQSSTGLQFFQFGAKFCNNFTVVRIFRALGQNQRMRIRLLEQIFCFVNLIGGIYGYKNGTQLYSCPKGNIPLRNVRCPNGYV